jgi:ethanolamine utilization protein EutN
MQIARVVGHAVSTVKHPTMKGWRLLVVQPVTEDDKPEGEPLLVVDHLGACSGSRVMISNDGKGARELIGSQQTPVRWFVMGLVDE